MARNQKMEHLQEEARSLDDHRTCNHHPIDLPPCMTPVFKLGFCPPTDQPCVVAEAQP
jgi:hypothetical protein